jgi:two-component system phosphate regulon response regulator PhoB
VKATPTTILVVEDEADIREVIEFNLAREGYAVVCDADGAKALDLVRRHRPALVLLDLMLPGRDGIEVCRALRADPELRGTPVIMLTAKGEESDIVLGLGVGADDYVPKPFSVRELVARVKAVLRRRSAEAAVAAGSGSERGGRPRVELEGVEIDPDRHEVLVDGEGAPFTATELRMLYHLATHPGRVYTREQLIERVLGPDAVVTDRNIDVHIRSVRQKLGPHRDLIETVRGVGYRFRDSRD